MSEIALLQKEGAVQDSIVDVNYDTARKIQKEVENFYYDMITKRMSAEAMREYIGGEWVYNTAITNQKVIDNWIGFSPQCLAVKKIKMRQGTISTYPTIVNKK